MFVIAATVNLVLLEQEKMSTEIDCPGDTITFNCSIESNTEDLHLVWTLTFPKMLPFEVLYDGTNLTFDAVDDNEMNVTTSLLNYDILDGYIESVITLTVLDANVSMDGTAVECSIADLDYKNITLLINTSGISLAKTQRNLCTKFQLPQHYFQCEKARCPLDIASIIAYGN